MHVLRARYSVMPAPWRFWLALALMAGYLPARRAHPSFHRTAAMHARRFLKLEHFR
jgi:hypothetical protein